MGDLTPYPLSGHASDANLTLFQTVFLETYSWSTDAVDTRQCLI